MAELPPAGVAVDLGCGRGEDLRLLAERHPSAYRFVGLDASAAAIAAADRATTDRRITFEQSALDGPLPFPDASVDLVFSHNLLECLGDPGRFAREIARILRPGGQAVVAHWDWDTQVFDGADKARIRRLVIAFADWQQAWMESADAWMGRRLWGVFNPLAAFNGSVHARVLTNTAFEPHAFGYENAHALRSLVRRGLATAEDCDGFLAEQAAVHSSGQYFYSITGYVFVGRRAPVDQAN